MVEHGALRAKIEDHLRPAFGDAVSIVRSPRFDRMTNS